MGSASSSRSAVAHGPGRVSTTRVGDSARACISAPSSRSPSPSPPCAVAYAAFSDHTTSSAVAGVPSEKRRPGRSVMSMAVSVRVM